MSAKYPHKPPDADGRCPDCSYILDAFADNDRCPTSMLARIAELERQLAEKSEWEASQHKLAARVVGEERAAIVADLRKQAANTAKYSKPLGGALRGTLTGLAQRYENGEHHTTEPTNG